MRVEFWRLAVRALGFAVGFAVLVLMLVLAQPAHSSAMAG